VFPLTGASRHPQVRSYPRLRPHQAAKIEPSGNIAVMVGIDDEQRVVIVADPTRVSL
jgi:hypothetical protein